MNPLQRFVILACITFFVYTASISSSSHVLQYSAIAFAAAGGLVFDYLADTRSVGRVACVAVLTFGHYLPPDPENVLSVRLYFIGILAVVLTLVIDLVFTSSRKTLA